MSAELPKLTYPRIMMMATDNFLGADLKRDPGNPSSPTRELMTWIVGHQHPFIPDMNVLAIFDTGKFIEVYSTKDAKSGDRDLIPERFVRFLREAMPFDVFQEELARAELGEDDDDEDDDSDEGGDESIAPVIPMSNGQPTT